MVVNCYLYFMLYLHLFSTVFVFRCICICIQCLVGDTWLGEKAVRKLPPDRLADGEGGALFFA